MNYLQPADMELPIPKKNPMTFNNNQTFCSTHLKINGKRPKVMIHELPYFNTTIFSVSSDEVNIIHKEHEDFGITRDMCGKTFEVVESTKVGSLYTGVIILMPTEGMGTIKRSLADWAIKKVVSVERNPQYYV